MPRRPSLGLLAAALALAAGCSGSSRAACDPLPSVRPGVCIIDVSERGAAPVTDLPLVVEDGSDTLAIDELAGHVVVVNFWASWCGPCRAEQPVLNDAFERLEDADVRFLGVNIQDSLPNALAHQREFDIQYPSVSDPPSAYAAQFGGIGPRSIPSTILLDRQGRVAARIFGDVFDPMELVVLVTRLVEE